MHIHGKNDINPLFTNPKGPCAFLHLIFKYFKNLVPGHSNFPDFMYMGVLTAYMCTACMPGALREQKGASLGLEMAVTLCP